MRPLFIAIFSFSIAIEISTMGCAAEAEHADKSVERGAYLVNAVAACANCHTPRSPPGPTLSGGVSFKVGAATIVSSNITPDTETGIGAWSDAQIIAAIRDDVRPDGSRIGPPMPQHAFASISNADAAAIVAYLRSVAPVRHKVEAAAGDRPSAPHEVKQLVPAPSMATASDRGRYLVNGPAHCVECHGIGAETAVAIVRSFKGPWGVVSAPNLSPTFMSRYTPGAFAHVVRTGLRSDGSHLSGPMPVASYKGLRSDDLADIAAYLGTQP